MTTQFPASAIDRARKLRHRATEAEKRLWWAMRDQPPCASFRRQVSIGPYIADFCCHMAKLIVEVDGGQHQPEADAERTAFLERAGYRVLRVWNNDVLAGTEGVIATIQYELMGCHPHLTSPLKGGGTRRSVSRRVAPFATPSAQSLPLGGGRLGGGDTAGHAARQVRP